MIIIAMIITVATPHSGEIFSGYLSGFTLGREGLIHLAQNIRHHNFGKNIDIEIHLWQQLLQ